MAAQPQTHPWLEESVIYPGPHPRILVADDDPYLVRVLKESLEHEGYDVTCAFDGMHAIHHVQERRFDLIILDVNMPVTNGFKVLEYLRTRPDTEGTPVIIVTGDPSGDIYPRVARDPRASYIKKPLDIESLNSVVKYYLKR
jgi:DNA-binding response OmpR family regulator